VPPAAGPVDSPGRPRNRRRLILRLAVGAAVVVLMASAAGILTSRHHSPDRPVAKAPAVAVAPVPGLCGPGVPALLTGNSAPPAGVPRGWVWQNDPAGFALPVPRGWTRTAVGGVVCFGDPGGTRAFRVEYGPPVAGQPLRVWQVAERTALTDGTLPAYRKVSMGVLLVTGGGADWEYTWQPATGPRLHAHRSVLAAGVARSIRLSWTTLDQDWAAGLATRRTLMDGLRDPSSSASPWAVQPPAR
jgi:hypothetical protein